MTQPVSSSKRAKRVDTIKVFDFVNSIFGETMHLKRVGSIADAAIGLLTAEELILHKMGAGFLRIPSFFKCSTKALSSWVVSPKVH